MDISFERGPEIGREQRTLPADHSRLTRLLFNRRQDDNLLVPIRSMQYLGIIDREEVALVDGHGPRVIEISWRDFRSGDRDDLRAAVTYTCVYYDEKGRAIMSRLQSAFFKVLELMQDRQPKSDGATITPLQRD